MDERPTKRRGPLLWLAAGTRRFWIVPIVAGFLPVLYVMGCASLIRLMLQSGLSTEQIQAVIWKAWAIVAAGYAATFIGIVVLHVCRPKWWTKWALAGVLALPVLYVTSYGPLVWASYNLKSDGVPGEIVSALVIYTLPLQMAISEQSPHWLREGILWYVQLWNR